MTAAAIRQSAANFPYCLANLWPDAARRNISRDSFDRYTAGLTPDLRIMDFVDAQPEFTKAVWDYLDILVTDARLARGREMLGTHRTAFDAVEKAYGVDRYIIAAIWGIESKYSTHGRRPQCAALHRDARLRRPQAGLFQGRISERAGNPASRRPARPIN